jgi:uncharacterized protein (TIGR02611 family)
MSEQTPDQTSVVKKAPGRIRRHGKRAGVFVVGWAVTLAGVAMIVLPGPGIVVIIAGLSILGIEFAWARRLRDKAQEKAKLAAAKAKSTVRR